MCDESLRLCPVCERPAVVGDRVCARATTVKRPVSHLPASCQFEDAFSKMKAFALNVRKLSSYVVPTSEPKRRMELGGFLYLYQELWDDP